MLKAIAILFAAIGIYWLYNVVSSQSYFLVIGVALALVAAAGLWFRKHWSQYVVYFVSVTYIIQWLWLVWRSMQAKLWPYESTVQSILALVPGLFLVAIAVSLSVLVYRGFRVRR